MVWGQFVSNNSVYADGAGIDSNLVSILNWNCRCELEGAVADFARGRKEWAFTLDTEVGH